jgi:hypothetical protein
MMKTRTELHAQLTDMRSTLIDQLRGRIDGGTLALLGSVGSALETLDRSPITAPIQPAGRVVVTEEGREIRLTVYHNEEIAIAVPLDPARALAGVLIRLGAAPAVGRVRAAKKGLRASSARCLSMP